MESLSAYARQFLGQMDKPDVDFIEGLSPAVSIDQKSTSRNPRSTVGTITEVYDYLRLLFARAGRPHCPICGEPISRQSPQQIVDRLMGLPEGTRFQVLAPVIRERKGEYAELFRQLASQGFARARVDGETIMLTDPPVLDKKYKHSIDVVVDRLAVKPTVKQRLTDSVETALGLAQGIVTVDFVDLDAKDPDARAALLGEAGLPERPRHRHRRARAAAVLLQRARGAPARSAPGLGTRMEVDPELVVPDDEKSLDEGAIAPWASAHVADYFQRLISSLAEETGFSTTVPWHSLPSAAKKVLLFGVPGQVHVRYRNRYGRERSYNAKYEGIVALHRASARRGRDRHLAGAVRGLHARGALHRVSRRPAEADLAGRHGRRQEHRRDRRPVHRRGGRPSCPAWSCRTARSRSPSGCSRRSTSA